MNLEKLTTRYIHHEDRILVSAQQGDEAVQMWLTQRLLLGLVPHLLNWAQAQKPDAEHSQVQATETAQAPQHHSAHGQKEQRDAQLLAQARPKVSAVTPLQNTPIHLVQTLRFEPRDQVLRLVFEGLPQEATLLLQASQARAWLSILFNAWQQAGWPDIWPHWMKQAHDASRHLKAMAVH